MYGQLIFDKGTNKIQWKMVGLLNKWCCNNWISDRGRQKKFDKYLKLTRNGYRFNCITKKL